MPLPKSDIAADGRPRHYTVGAVIKRDGKYLLSERLLFPLGFNSICGHVDEGEDADHALVREVMEETSLRVTSATLLFEEELSWDTCSGGTPIHYWRLYECEVEGELVPTDTEAKNMGWYTPGVDWPDTMIPQWKYWFKKLGVTE
jgi:8-oxo-dGTP pyrophosphatase MutT (NUDIX family)